MKKRIISLVLTVIILFSFLPVILEGQSKIDGYSINPKVGRIMPNDDIDNKNIVYIPMVSVEIGNLRKKLKKDKNK